jgi:polyphosphate kinase
LHQVLPNSLESIGCAAIAADVDLNDSNYYLKRELSYIQFNLRVLVQVRNKQHPLLERLMFLLIFSSNLDEFYEIRVIGVEPSRGGRQRIIRGIASAAFWRSCQT